MQEYKVLQKACESVCVQGKNDHFNASFVEDFLAVLRVDWQQGGLCMFSIYYHITACYSVDMQNHQYTWIMQAAANLHILTSEQPESRFVPLLRGQSVKSVLCKQKEKHRCDAKTPPYTILIS